MKIRNSLKWFTNLIKNVFKGKPSKGSDDWYNPRKDVFIGGLFFFVYDPKYKDELPYWDKYPLVIPFSMTENGFIGINLHYLPPKGRKAILNKLIKYKKNASSKRAYMDISYKLLLSLSKSLTIEKTIHRYLSSHIVSGLVSVKEENWMNAAMLPVQQFQKKSARHVWRQ